MTTKKKKVSLLLIVLALVSLLTGVLFSMPNKTVDTVYASRDSNGTNTDDEWTGTQDTPNLIPILKEGSIASQGWKVSSDGNTKVAANTVHESNSLGWVIKSSGNGTDLGAYGYTGGVYYTLTLSEADRVKANAGQLYVSGEAGFYVQMWAKARYSIRVEFYNSGGAQIGKEGTTHEGSSGWGDATDTWGLGWIKVPVGTCTIQVWFSNHNTLDGRPYIANPSCSLHDTTPPSVSGISLDKSSVADSNKGIAVAGNTIKYSVEFNEKVSITNKGTATITLDGNSFATSNNAELITVSGKSRVCYTFTLPDENKNGTIRFSTVSGLSVKDEAGNTTTVNGGDYSSAPTLQYYRKMGVSSSLTHLTFSGEGKATYNTNYTATLSAAHGYNLPNSITVKVGGSTLAQGSDYTYNSGTGAITIYGSKITDDIVITAAGVPKQSGVTFYKESGTGGTESTTATFDAAMPAIETPTRTGYTFQGYFTQSGGEGIQYYNAVGGTRNCDFDSAISLYAHWTANHYTIKFDQNKPANASSNVQGSTPDTPRVYDDGEIALPKNGFTLTGWTFQGWATSSVGAVVYENEKAVQNLTSDPNGTYTLYAVWKANSYTITLDAMGGTNASSFSATFDSEIPGITVPERYGYKFLGYFDRGTGGVQYYGTDGQAYGGKTLTVVGGITLYAHWEAITYTIRLYNEGVFVADLEGITFGELTLPKEETYGLSRKNFDFVGWNLYDEQNWAMYYADTFYAVGLAGTQDEVVVLYAAWLEKPIHALFYDANGGSGAPAAEQLHEGEGTTIQAGPVRDDYTFAGWGFLANSDVVSYRPDDPFTMGTEGVTLYAVWKHNPSLTYSANGGEFHNTIAAVYPAAGTEVTITKAEPVREGYQFLGWAVTATDAETVYHAEEAFSMPDGDTVLYAVWEIGEYNVSTEVAEGYTVNGLTGSYPFGTEVSFTVTGTKPRVYINGERAEEQGGQYTFTVKGDTTIFVADGTKLSLVYSANGGEDAPTDKTTYSAGSNANISPEKPERTGYTFQGWAEDKDAAEATYSPEDPIEFGADQEEDTVLYAVWEANTYTVSYHDTTGADGSMDDSSYSYGTPEALAINGFTKTGYNFIGWATSAGGEVVFKDGDSVLNLTAENGGEIELYARWEKMKTLIRFSAGEEAGGGSASLSVEYGDALPTSGVMAPVRKGYTFGGYFTEEEGQGDPIFGANMLPISSDPWTNPAQDLTLHAYWIPTPETLEKSVDEVQAQLEGATQALQASIDGNQRELSSRLTDLNEAYIEADRVLKQALLDADDGLKAELVGMINGLQKALEGADAALQSAIDALAARLDKDIDELQASVGQNKTNIDKLQSALTQLEADYLAADTALRADFAAADTGLQSNIDALETKLKAVDENLDAAIKQLQADLKQTVADLEKSISDNRGEIDKALAELQEAYEAADRIINNQITALQNRDSELAQSISDLTDTLDATDQRLQAAIEQVQQNLNDAAAALRAAIDANEKDIEDKVSAMDAAYKDADATLRSDMNTADRQLGDEIEQAVNDLTSAMNKTENDLRDAIDQVQQNLNSAVAALQQTINDNKQDIEDKLAAMGVAYQQADAALRSDMNDADTALGKRIDDAISDLTSAMNDVNDKLQDAIDKVQQNLNDAVADLQSSLRQNRTEIEDELSAMSDAYKAADAIIHSDIADLQERDNTFAKNLAVLDYSYKAADHALQVAIGQVQDNLDSAVAALQAAIAANETDIEDKVSALDAAYQTADTVLRSDMAAADKAIEDSVAALGTAMNDADAALQKAIDKVQTNLDRAVEDLQAAIDANEKDIEDKVQKLDSAYQAADTLLRSDMAAADEALEQAMNDADSALQKAIDKVQTNLDNAVEDLQAAIDANETDIEKKVQKLDSAYKAADTLLRSDMTAADEDLEAKIAALEKATNAADSALQKAIDKVQTNLDNAVAELQAALKANGTDIEAKVSALDSAYKAADALIDSGIAGLKAQDSALAESISALDSAYKAADEALWAGIRQVEGKHDALKEESEQIALTYMIVNIALGAVAAGLIVTLVVKAVKKKNSQE